MTKDEFVDWGVDHNNKWLNHFDHSFNDYVTNTSHLTDNEKWGRQRKIWNIGTGSNRFIWHLCLSVTSENCVLPLTNDVPNSDKIRLLFPW